VTRIPRLLGVTGRLGVAPVAIAVVTAAVIGAPLVARSLTGPRNLVSNGSFAKSVDFWAPWRANLVRTEHGDTSAGAARVLSIGKARSYAVYTLPPPVVNLLPGLTFTAEASVQSARPGQVCLLLREWGAASKPLAIAQRCMIGSRRWRRFPALSYATRADGTRLELSVVRARSGRGDWFAVDDVTLESRR
jgi:hypothetical protein